MSTDARTDAANDLAAQSGSGVDERLPAAKTATFAIQHLLIMYGGAVAVPLAFGAAMDLDQATIAMLVNADLLVCGIITIIQSLGVGRILGARLPIIGGALTWNAFVYGVTSALAIATLLICAATLSAAVRQADLIRLLPSRVATLGIAGTVALTLIPQTIAAAREIYDAQRARGYRFRGLRDASSLLTPLLAAGLERSLVLAEALETRGFGASRSAQPTPRRRWPLFGAGVAIVLALALIGTGRVLPGVGMVVVAIVASLVGVGGQQPRSRFRPLVWDAASVAVCAVAGLVVVLAVSLARGALTFSPFPRLETPPFDSIVGGAILLLLLPAVWSDR